MSEQWVTMLSKPEFRPQFVNAVTGLAQKWLNSLPPHPGSCIILLAATQLLQQICLKIFQERREPLSSAGEKLILEVTAEAMKIFDQSFADFVRRVRAEREQPAPKRAPMEDDQPTPPPVSTKGDPR
jgi:hypothetical protein